MAIIKTRNFSILTEYLTNGSPILLENDKMEL